MCICLASRGRPDRRRLASVGCSTSPLPASFWGVVVVVVVGVVVVVVVVVGDCSRRILEKMIPMPRSEVRENMAVEHGEFP